MGTLPGLLPDVGAGRLAGDEIGLQSRHHHRSLDGGRRRTLVRPGDADCTILGVLGGRLLHCIRPDVFLETIANPYTTVLGPNQYAATRINLAQSCNGIGWILGPIVGGMFFYSKDAAGQSTGSQTLWIPYAIITGVVTVLAIIFWFADVPDIKSEDDYHLDDKEAEAPAERQLDRPLIYLLLCLNAALLAGVFGMISWLVLSACGMEGQSLSWVVYGGAGVC